MPLELGILFGEVAAGFIRGFRGARGEGRISVRHRARRANRPYYVESCLFLVRFSCVSADDGSKRLRMSTRMVCAICALRDIGPNDAAIPVEYLAMRDWALMRWHGSEPEQRMDEHKYRIRLDLKKGQRRILLTGVTRERPFPLSKGREGVAAPPLDEGELDVGIDADEDYYEEVVLAVESDDLILEGLADCARRIGHDVNQVDADARVQRQQPGNGAISSRWTNVLPHERLALRIAVEVPATVGERERLGESK